MGIFMAFMVETELFQQRIPHVIGSGCFRGLATAIAVARQGPHALRPGTSFLGRRRFADHGKKLGNVIKVGKSWGKWGKKPTENVEQDNWAP